MNAPHVHLPGGYLGCVHGELQILGQAFPVTLLLYGRSQPLAEGGACTVIDSVRIGKTEISGHLPSEAYEALTTHVNSPAVSA